MSEIVVQTLEDLRGGRTSWRVLVLVFVPAFAAGLLVSLA
jgi:hypothetical protein